MHHKNPHPRKGKKKQIQQKADESYPTQSRQGAVELKICRVKSWAEGGKTKTHIERFYKQGGETKTTSFAQNDGVYFCFFPRTASGASSRLSARLNSSELVTTATELQLMMAPAIAGESISPHPGRKAPAATGIATAL